MLKNIFLFLIFCSGTNFLQTAYYELYPEKKGVIF